MIWTDPVLLTPFADPIVAKFKVPHRREYAPPDLEDGDDGVEGFAERAIGLERLRHAREHLESRGRWREPIAAMKDAVIKRAIQDVAREVDEYHARLRQHGKKAVRAALRQVAEARWSAFVADAE